MALASGRNLHNKSYYALSKFMIVSETRFTRYYLPDLQNRHNHTRLQIKGWGGKEAQSLFLWCSTGQTKNPWSSLKLAHVGSHSSLFFKKKQRHCIWADSQHKAIFTTAPDILNKTTHSISLRSWLKTQRRGRGRKVWLGDRKHTPKAKRHRLSHWHHQFKICTKIPTWTGLSGEINWAGSQILRGGPRGITEASLEEAGF